MAQYVIREHDRGRPLAEILEDRYVLNRLESPEQRARLLDRPEIVQAVGERHGGGRRRRPSAPRHVDLAAQRSSRTYGTPSAAGAPSRRAPSRSRR